ERLAATDAAAAAPAERLPALAGPQRRWLIESQANLDTLERLPVAAPQQLVRLFNQAFAQAEAQREVVDVGRCCQHHREAAVADGEHHGDFIGDEVRLQLGALLARAPHLAVHDARGCL